MEYFELEPEVAGELGEKTIIDTTTHPPIVGKLEFIFTGWLGDDIIECFPVFLVSERLKKLLQTTSLSGFTIEECDINISEKMRELKPSTNPGQFFWLKVYGKSNLEDFFISSDNMLIVSSKALEILNQVRIENCLIEEYLNA